MQESRGLSFMDGILVNSDQYPPSIRLTAGARAWIDLNATSPTSNIENGP